MRTTLLSLLALLMLSSCSEQEEPASGSSGGTENVPAGVSRVLFKTGPQSQCVYIFRKEGDVFRYDSMINSGWSEEGTATARLVLGDYKFLFTGPLNGDLDVLPATLDKTVTWEQLRFASRPDNGLENGILPAGELFLPEPEVADSVYAIRGDDEIACTLKRRVSQLTFAVKRGFKDGDIYVPQPFAGGQDILSMVDQLEVEIYGVARSCNYAETSGTGNVLRTYSASDDGSTDPDGFVTFTGPFVFPPSDGSEVRLKITPGKPSGETYPPVEITRKLEANRQLEVNLWMSSSQYDIGVTVHTSPISQETEGDKGVWE